MYTFTIKISHIVYEVKAVLKGAREIWNIVWI